MPKPYPTTKEIEEIKEEFVQWNLSYFEEKGIKPMSTEVVHWWLSKISSIRSADLEWFLERIESKKQGKLKQPLTGDMWSDKKELEYRSECKIWNAALDSLKEEVLKLKQ